MDDIIIYGENYLPVLVDMLHQGKPEAKIHVYLISRWSNKTIGEIYELLLKYGYTGSNEDILDMYNEARLG